MTRMIVLSHEIKNALNNFNFAAAVVIHVD
jgi:hypothetical protein